MKKRILSILLVLVMLAGMLPVNVFAAESLQTIETGHVAEFISDRYLSQITMSGAVVTAQSGSDYDWELTLAPDTDQNAELTFDLTASVSSMVMSNQGGKLYFWCNDVMSETTLLQANPGTVSITPTWENGTAELVVGFGTATKIQIQYYLTLKIDGAVKENPNVIELGETKTKKYFVEELVVSDAVTVSAAAVSNTNFGNSTSGHTADIQIELESMPEGKFDLTLHMAASGGCYVACNGGSREETSNESYTTSIDLLEGTYYQFITYSTASNSTVRGTYTVTFTVKGQSLNTLPVLADSSNNSASAQLKKGAAYTLELSPLFRDADNDTLTYNVAIDDAEPVAAAASYSIVMEAAGKYTLVFRANDGTADSEDCYTVTLEVTDNTAPALTGEASGHAAARQYETWSCDLAALFSDAEGDKLTYYVKNADGSWTALSGQKYEYTPCSEGARTIVFKASDGALDSQEYTLTLDVEAQTLSNVAVISNSTSTGSLDFVKITDSDGNDITAAVAVLDGYHIQVTLPRNLGETGSVRAVFYLTQNAEGLPFVTPKTGTSGVSSGKAWDQRTNTYTITLSGGKATQQVYFYDHVPSHTTNTYETYTISCQLANQVPTRAENAEETLEAQVKAGEQYTLDLAPLFTDADGDALNYQYKVGEGEWTSCDANFTYSNDVSNTYILTFRAYDNYDHSQETVTLTLTVTDDAETYAVKVTVPEGVTPAFYSSDGSGTVGTELSAQQNGNVFVVAVPNNVSYIAWRSDGIGASAAVARNAELRLVKAEFMVMAGESADTGATVAVTQGDTEILGSANTFLLLADIGYTYTATPANSNYRITTVEIQTPVDGVNVIDLVPKHFAVVAPAGSVVSAGTLNGSFNYSWATPIDSKTVDNTVIYRFAPLSGNAFIRVQRPDDPDAVTYWDYESSKADEDTIVVTEEMLFMNDSETTNFNAGTVYRHFEKYELDLGDIYLNINEKGYIDLDVGATKQLNVFRNWQAIEGISNSKIALPDFSYEIITIDGSNVVSIDKDSNNSAVATLTARSEGTAIILVTYDAMYSTLAAHGKIGTDAPTPEEFSAIWPDRTGVFVVSVGKDGSAIQTNMTCNGVTFDAEHSPQFYTGTAGASVSFKPEDGCTVTVNRSTVGTETLTFGTFTDQGVSVAEDGTVTVSGLTSGRHIIRVEKDGVYTYQVVTATQVTAEIKDADGKVLSASDKVKPGETVTLTVTGLTSPAEKFATAYNFNFQLTYLDQDKNTYQNSAGTGYGGYDFNCTPQVVKIKVPEDWNRTELVLNGYINLGGFANVPIGGHRNYAYGVGKGQSEGTAPSGLMLGTLPVITIPVDIDNVIPVTSVELDQTAAELEVGKTLTLTAAVKPDDATIQTVTWTSSDETIATVTDGIVTAVGEGTATITAAAGDCRAECVITVTKAPGIAVTGITLNKTSAELKVGHVLALQATITPANATDKTVIWTSSDESIATVADGSVTAVAEGTVIITAKAGDFSAACEVTVVKDEDLDGKATVYFSVSHDAEFIMTDQGIVAALQKLDVPYFDLSLYGLDEYKLAETDAGYGKPTMLHLYIYATEILQCGVKAENAGQGYLCQNGLIGTDLFTVSGSAGSIFMEKFWNMSLNLNYYHNYSYPADSSGWGITADRVVLSDGDIVTIGHFTSWGFYTDSSSVFNYLVIGEDTVVASAVENSEITLNVYRAGADMGSGGTNTPVEAERDIYYIKADALTSGDVTSWTKLGTTDAAGQLKVKLSELTAGQYILAIAGQKGVENPDDIVSTPGGIILNVLESAAGNQVQDVIDLIDAIGEVTLDSETAIQAARTAYDALTEDQKAAVTNYSKLEDAEAALAALQEAKADQDAADAVTAKIDAIGTVTLDSKAAIEEARAAYDALTDAQKALVSEETLKILTDAEAAYAKLVADEADQAAAKAVEEKIAAIGTVTLDSENAINEARSAYEALTDVQKALVTNLDALIAAEKKLAELKDEAAADAVETLISAIGTVTLDSEEAIQAAREAYEKLTDTQKALVENYAVLAAAEETLALLKLSNADILSIYQNTGDYLEGLSAPAVGATNGEWRVIGLARAGRDVADSYYDAVVEYVKANIDENGRLHEAKSTDNSRIIVALTAIGKDVTDVGGCDLLSGLDDMAYIGNQGINGTIWALIAFDTHNYDIPAGDVTREKLVAEIVNAQLAGGGWALSGTVGDPDMTGMALQALAPYYGKYADATAAVDKALTWLSGIQAKDGTFSGSEGTTSESVSQVITGLTALGINPETDSRFIKNGVSVVDALSAFYVDGGGFKHGMTGSRNMMATEQAYYALVSYYRLLQDKTSLYDMSDVTIQTAAKDQEAAKAVEALINAIGTVTTESGEAIDAARNAYDALTEEQKALVSNYETLTAAETAYAELVKTAADQAAAKAVEDKIGAIGTVTLNSEGAIKEARAAYENLTAIQKALVSNLAALEAAEKALAGLKDEAEANAVEKLISAIGTVTLDSEEKITAARRAYDALTANQKNLVENYKTLLDAESKLNELKSTVSVTFTLLGCSKHGEDKVHTLTGGNLSTWIAKKTYMVAPGATVRDVLEKALAEAGMSWRNPTGNYVESINGIGEFSNGSNSGWMYTLNGTHPNLGVAEQTVKNGDVIVFHYTDDYTKEEGSQGYGDRDEEAAEKVEKLIDAIGTVTLNSKSKIDVSRKAYDALTYTQKQKVSNYAKLTAAESKYAQLKSADDEKKAEAVENLIDAIMEGSTAFEDHVKAAQKAYSNLTADQKKLVDNYYKLANYLKDLADEEDKEAAEAVEKLIDAIGAVNLDSEEKIKAAREAYEKLTDEQKALVSNLAVLKAAENKLEECKATADVEDIYKTTGDYLEALGMPGVGSVGGEWMVIGLTRSGREIVDADAWYDAAVEYVQENIDENERLHQAKSTENARLILALTAIGKDVTNVGGSDLLKGLNTMEYIQKQGINGPIWALLAFDSGNYPVPEGDVSREALIQTILDAQLADGGWALTGTVSDPDITGMALQALAPYYKTDATVKAVIDEAIVTLSEMQGADGSYASIDGTSSESISQVIVALAALGIDADKDSRFIKNGVSALDALCAFYVEGGGFRHIPTGKLDGMATEQGYYALTAYFRMLDGESALYDMTDVINMGGDTVEEESAETLPAVTEPAPAEPVPTDEDKGGFPWWLVIVIVVLAGAIVVLVIVSKPKKRSKVR